MRRILCCLALLAALMGSLTHRANAQASDATKIVVPSNLIKECADKLAKEAPGVKIVGKYLLARRSKNSLARLVDHADVVAVLAPSTHTTLLGLKYMGYTGCLYDVKNGTLVFRQLAGANFFPRRYKREPGED